MGFGLKLLAIRLTIILPSALIIPIILLKNKVKKFLPHFLILLGFSAWLTAWSRPVAQLAEGYVKPMLMMWQEAGVDSELSWQDMTCDPPLVFIASELILSCQDNGRGLWFLAGMSPESGVARFWPLPALEGQVKRYHIYGLVPFGVGEYAALLGENSEREALAVYVLGQDGVAERFASLPDEGDYLPPVGFRAGQGGVEIVRAGYKGTFFWSCPGQSEPCTKKPVTLLLPEDGLVSRVLLAYHDGLAWNYVLGRHDLDAEGANEDTAVAIGMAAEFGELRAIQNLKVRSLLSFTRHAGNIFDPFHATHPKIWSGSTWFAPEAPSNLEMGAKTKDAAASFDSFHLRYVYEGGRWKWLPQIRGVDSGSLNSWQQVGGRWLGLGHAEDGIYLRERGSEEKFYVSGPITTDLEQWLFPGPDGGVWYFDGDTYVTLDSALERIDVLDTSGRLSLWRKDLSRRYASESYVRILANIAGVLLGYPLLGLAVFLLRRFKKVAVFWGVGSVAYVVFLLVVWDEFKFAMALL